MRALDPGKKIVQTVDVGHKIESEMDFLIEAIFFTGKHLVGLDVQLLPIGAALR